MGDHAKPRLGLSMFDTIGVVCLLRYVHDLAGAKEGRFCDLPITCTSYAHHRQPISVASVDSVVGSMLAIPLTSA